MQTLCIFLRGINVNGIKIKMQDLKEAFVNLGFQDVRTILATGNVVGVYNECISEPELKAKIELHLSQYFGYQANVFLRTIEEMKIIREKAEAIDVADSCHLYVLLCETEQIVRELESVFNEKAHLESEQILASGQNAFWIVPKGETLNSEFGSKVLGSKNFKDKLTSRNFNTILKI